MLIHSFKWNYFKQFYIPKKHSILVLKLRGKKNFARVTVINFLNSLYDQTYEYTVKNNL